MTTARQQHPVRLIPPFYSNGPHGGLHRYLDAEFVNRFRQDVQNRRFDNPQFSQWMAEEMHSRHDEKPVLRLPLHRAFHLFVCEVMCEQLGQPALCPDRINSAGFVIRRVHDGNETAWMVEEGEPVGWEDAPTEFRDPDLHRRLCAAGILHKRLDKPAYSGEQVHPLHVLNTATERGKRHTLLYGFVPLGGFYYLRNSGEEVIDATSQNEVLRAAGLHLSWPFGYRGRPRHNWRNTDSRPVDRGQVSLPFFELLQLLVQRYHLGEPGIEENRALEEFCKQLHFYDETHFDQKLGQRAFSDANRDRFAAHRHGTLFTYLQRCFSAETNNPLVGWLAIQEAQVERAAEAHRSPRLDKLPRPDGTGNMTQSLLISAADAQNLRQILGQRLRDQTLAKVREIPLPKFGQEKSDIYQIVPFVRFSDKQGREQIQWADARARSVRFRVAAPFDPEASRPSLIQMPSLNDLRRGMARGASLITPSDTFNLLDSLKLKKGAGPDALPQVAPGAGLGLQWICSFSLPVITLVAMILLMIMISLLNIIFFWMPWVRICLPFPKLNK